MCIRDRDDSDATVSGTVTELPSEAYGRFYYVIETDSVMPEDGTVKSVSYTHLL